MVSIIGDAVSQIIPQSIFQHMQISVLAVPTTHAKDPYVETGNMVRVQHDPISILTDLYEKVL